jgi:hypothetical protein
MLATQRRALQAYEDEVAAHGYITEAANALAYDHHLRPLQQLRAGERGAQRWRQQRDEAKRQCEAAGDLKTFLDAMFAR